MKGQELARHCSISKSLGCHCIAEGALEMGMNEGRQG
jgi:hypothetical protein